jgi:ethanolamine kinase
LSGSDELSVLPKRVVLRVYGDNTEKFVDREDEVATMELLHRHGFGPSVLGTFANGRIESFLELVCLNPDDISKAEYRGRIAQTLARFHRVSEHGGLRSSGEPMTPFKKTREWLETAKTLDFSDASGMKEKFEALNVDGVMAEVDIVASVAALCNSPVVFAHNDLLSGNIMVSEYNDRQMTFIDFEYADWAPRGFDLGNHFCEYAGFDGDYSKYPTDSSDFVTEYLTVFNGGRKPVRD